jgi:hypothetical protein
MKVGELVISRTLYYCLRRLCSPTSMGHKVKQEVAQRLKHGYDH